MHTSSSLAARMRHFLYPLSAVFKLAAQFVHNQVRRGPCTYVGTTCRVKIAVQQES